MIGTINIKVNAANPNLPLAKFFAFLASPSNVRVVDVPRKIGKWAITKVFVTANYPDNSSHSVECALDGGCWHATLPASAAVGTSVNGFKVMANGVSEDGSTAVSGYVLGAGDLEILSTDGTITVGETTYYTHLLDTVPATPHKGDLCVIDGVWKIYTGSAWQPLAGGGGDVKRADFAAVEALPEEFTENEMRSKLNTVISILKTGATTLLLSACCLLPGVLFSATVQTALKGDIKNTAPIVTNVTFEGLEPGNYAAVSNAAMTAVQPAALDDYLPKTWKDNPESEFAGTAATANYAGGAQYLSGMYQLREDENYHRWGAEGVDEEGVIKLFAYIDEVPTAETLRAVTYAEGASEDHKTAAGILAVAERRAETKIAEADTTYTATNAVVSLNQSVQYVEANGFDLAILIPPAVTSGCRDWLVYVNATADTPLDLSALPHILVADAAYTNKCAANKVTALYITEMTNDVFVIGRQELTPVK